MPKIILALCCLALLFSATPVMAQDAAEKDKAVIYATQTPTPEQAQAKAQVKAEDRTCKTDADCTIIPISCNSCCPTFDLGEVEAVNAASAQTYNSLGVCTVEHIKACGVPECGLAPTPYPAATCQSGVCTAMMHPAPEQPEAPQTPPSP